MRSECATTALHGIHTGVFCGARRHHQHRSDSPAEKMLAGFVKKDACPAKALASKLYGKGVARAVRRERRSLLGVMRRR